MPGVAERFQGREGDGFRRRPTLPIDEILVQDGAVATFIEALVELTGS